MPITRKTTLSIMEETLATQLYIDQSINFDQALMQYGHETIFTLQCNLAKNNNFQLLLDKKKVKYYEYLTTFTLKNPQDKERLYLLLSGLHKRKALQIVEYHLTKEHWDPTQHNNPHCHTYIKATKPLPKSAIKYYERFGLIDHKPMTPDTEQQIHEYLNKENTASILLTPQNGGGV